MEAAIRQFGPSQSIGHELARTGTVRGSWIRSLPLMILASFIAHLPLGGYSMYLIWLDHRAVAGWLMALRIVLAGSICAIPQWSAAKAGLVMALAMGISVMPIMLYLNGTPVTSPNAILSVFYLLTMEFAFAVAVRTFGLWVASRHQRAPEIAR
jgi:hypothetical protein